MLCYIIGITFAAKNENFSRVEHAWPLGFLAVPVIYGAVLAFEQPVVLLPLVLFTGWIVFSMCLLMRRGSGALPLTVVRLLAGISILDAMILAGHAQFVLMTCALLAFILTLHLPRWVGGT